MTVTTRGMQESVSRAKAIGNKWITGTPDLFLSETDDIHNAAHIVDIKSSWDLHTYLKSRYSPLPDGYYWQVMGYMALTGAKSAEVTFCLVNTPESIINDELRKFCWKAGIIDDGSRTASEILNKLRREMTFDDIPEIDRVHTFTVDRDEDAVNSIYDKVKECRNYMNETFI